jgi:hypothetical protein
MKKNIRNMKSSIVSALKRQPHIRDLNNTTPGGRRRVRKILGLKPDEPIALGAVDLARNRAAEQGYTQPKPRGHTKH